MYREIYLINNVVNDHKNDNGDGDNNNCFDANLEIFSFFTMNFSFKTALLEDIFSMIHCFTANNVLSSAISSSSIFQIFAWWLTWEGVQWHRFDYFWSLEQSPSQDDQDGWCLVFCVMELSRRAVWSIKLIVEVKDKMQIAAKMHCNNQRCCVYLVI